MVRLGHAGVGGGLPRSGATVHEVFDANVVAAAESLAVVMAKGAFDVGMAVLVAVVDVGPAVVVEVLAGAFDAVVKAAAGGVVELGRGRVPAAAGAVLVCAGRRRWWALLELCVGGGCGEDEAGGERECGKRVTSLPSLQGEPASGPDSATRC